MDPITIGFIGIVLMVILIFAGFNVGVVLSFVGFVGFLVMLGPEKAFRNMYLIPFATCIRYEFAVVPLFLLMGTVVGRAGIGEDAYLTARAWVGHIRGGLAMATVCACGLFAATSGSSLATAVTMGKVAYPEMRKLRYDPTLAIGCIAAGGSLGLLIPPSMAFILIGILTEVSIGKLFLAGIIPGIDALDMYPWTGHSAIIGKQDLDWFKSREVLAEFSDKLKSSRKAYANFILDGLSAENEEDLSGGGLIRSKGGYWETLKAARRNEKDAYDERILGTGEFVERVLRFAEEKENLFSRLKRNGWDFPQVLDCAAETVGAAGAGQRERQHGPPRVLDDGSGDEEVGRRRADQFEVSGLVLQVQVALGVHAVQHEAHRVVTQAGTFARPIGHAVEDVRRPADEVGKARCLRPGGDGPGDVRTEVV